MALLRRSMLEGPGNTASPRPRSEINLQWLIHLRWAAIGGQLITVLVVRYMLRLDIPIAALLGVIAIEFGTNAGLLVILRKLVASRFGGIEGAGDALPPRRIRNLQLAVLVLDTLLLTALLALTGGTSNPFCAFMVVHVALAAVLLPLRHSIVAAVVVAAAITFLQLVPPSATALDESPTLRGWGTVVAVALTSLLCVFFVSRVASALVRRSEQLEMERERRERRRHLEALGTLAAGAAHELGTPLSTIAIVAKELELRLARTEELTDELTDARLIRDEVARCRRILDRMSTDAGGGTGETLAPTTLAELAEHVVGEMASGDRVDIEIHDDHPEIPLELPRQGLATSIRAIIQNALDASMPDVPVSLDMARGSRDLRVTIDDRGEGMEPANVERALEPFFTTKDVGRGMGLGLYLASSFIESLGGQLSIDSRSGVGTTVRIVVPLGRTGRGGMAPPVSAIRS